MEKNTQIAAVGQKLPQRMQQAQPVNLTQTGNDNTQICIGGARSYTELSHTHWAIKRINLIEVLERAGYRVFKL